MLEKNLQIYVFCNARFSTFPGYFRISSFNFCLFPTPFYVPFSISNNLTEIVKTVINCSFPPFVFDLCKSVKA